jgi:hypothetical protein
MTAKGKINASNVTTTDRIIVNTNGGAYEGDTVRPSATKTGEGVVIARVLDKLKAAGRRGYVIVTSAGSFYAEPIQTMWLAPEDNAGIKRAYAEALIEDAARPAVEVTEEPAEAPTPAELVESMDEAHEATTAQCPNEWHRSAPARRRMLCPECPAPAACADCEESEEAGQHEGWAGHPFRPAADEAPTECPLCGGPLASDGVCADDTCGADEVDPECEAKGCDIPEGLGECRRCGAELLQIEEPEDLTLNSHAGKVDSMNNDANATETQPTTDGQPTEHTGSTVVRLIEKVWDAIRAEHPELPRVVVTTGSGEGVKWGHFRPDSWKSGEEKFHEFFLASEALAKGATQVLQTTIHEAAHTLNRVRGVKDTTRQNRYHNGHFRKTAEELGLEHKGKTADSTHGFSFVTLTQATKDKYADLLAELERELKLTGLLPWFLGGTDEEDEKGGEKITKPKKGEGEDGGETKPNTNNIKCVCDCEEPNIIRMSRKVLALGVVNCGDCDALFHEA